MHDFPIRKSNRLKNYNYSSPGAYFITVCTYNKKKILSEVCSAGINELPEIKLTLAGKVVDDVIKKIADRFGVRIDRYIIMPNHLHMIISITDSELFRSIHESTLQSRSVLSKVIGYIKMNSSKQIRLKSGDIKVWQRSYHDHIIRNEKDYQNIYNYVEYNALKWKEDCFYC